MDELLRELSVRIRDNSPGDDVVEESLAFKRKRESVLSGWIKSLMVVKTEKKMRGL